MNCKWKSKNNTSCNRHIKDGHTCVFHKNNKNKRENILFNHYIKKEKIRLDTKKMLDEMHKQKIDMSDEIYVINLNGYIGESTKSEIEYANSKGKNISYLE